MNYTYYLQQDKTQGIRRYPQGQSKGERWDREAKTWTTECAERRACELTHDKVLSENEALALL